MITNLEAILAFTKREEGGYSCDRGDSGNWTSGVVGKGLMIGSNMGVGAPALVSWVARGGNGVGYDVAITADAMCHLDPRVYKAIALEDYWNVMPCDWMPAGLDLMIFDYGWNRGPNNSVHELQEALGVVVDGHFGPASRAKLRAINDLPSLVQCLAGVQALHYHTLRNFNRYGDGWLARTGRRQAAALEMLANTVVG